MSNVHQVEAWRKSATQQLGLNSDGGGGTSGGMEARVSVLETKVDRLIVDVDGLRNGIEGMRTDIGGVKERLSALEVRVDHLPSKGFIVSTLLLGFAIMSGITVFSEQIRLIIAG